MVVYELTHVFFRYADELVHSPKALQQRTDESVEDIWR